MMMLAFVSFSAPPLPDHSPQDDIKIEIASYASYDIAFMSDSFDDVVLITTSGDDNVEMTNAMVSMTDLNFYQHDQHYDNDVGFATSSYLKSNDRNIGHLLKHPDPGRVK